MEGDSRILYQTNTVPTHACFCLSKGTHFLKVVAPAPCPAPHRLHLHAWLYLKWGLKFSTPLTYGPCILSTVLVQTESAFSCSVGVAWRTMTLAESLTSTCKTPSSRCNTNRLPFCSSNGGQNHCIRQAFGASGRRTAVRMHMWRLAIL